MEIINDKNKLQPIVYQKLQEVIKKMGEAGYLENRHYTVFETLRTNERQNYLYEQGKTKATAGWSFHQYGVAVDCVPLVDGKPSWVGGLMFWNDYGRIAKEVGFEWGGDWKSFVDKPHIQYPQGYSIEDFYYSRVDLDQFNINQLAMEQYQRLQDITVRPVKFGMIEQFFKDGKVYESKQWIINKDKNGNAIRHHFTGNFEDFLKNVKYRYDFCKTENMDKIPMGDPINK